MVRAVPQEGSRRGSRGGRLPAKASAPDLDVAARAAALQARVDEQDIELAALRVCIYFALHPDLAVSKVGCMRGARSGSITGGLCSDMLAASFVRTVQWRGGEA
jgi:hypothetical protein